MEIVFDTVVDTVLVMVIENFSSSVAITYAVTLADTEAPTLNETDPVVEDMSVSRSADLVPFQSTCLGPMVLKLLPFDLLPKYSQPRPDDGHADAAPAGDDTPTTKASELANTHNNAQRPTLRFVTISVPHVYVSRPPADPNEQYASNITGVVRSMLSLRPIPGG